MDMPPHEAFADKEAEEATPCHFWCTLTQTSKGKDDQMVHRDTCTPSRSCFEE
jgi:hypothetical protein